MTESYEITVQELHAAGLDNPDHVLIDIREPWEVRLCAFEPSVKIPLLQLLEDTSVLEPFLEQKKKLILVCHHGVRTLRMAMHLQERDIPSLSLKGGIDAWANEIDPTILLD